MKKSIDDRFWSKVNILTPFECWPWKAAVRRKDEGYGAFWYKGQHRPASRMAWILIFGSIPKNIHVCHSCDNPNCCNPEHLFIGTNKDNNNDKVKKNRHAFGERTNTAILTENKVLEIISAKPSGRCPQGFREETAKRYGVSNYTIYDIWSGNTWRHLRDDHKK